MEIKEVLTEGWKVDKIKLKYIMQQQKDVQEIVDKLEIDPRIEKRYPSNDFKKANMNYTLETEKASIYIGVGSNQLKGNEDEKRKTIFIEYNPQKTDLFKTINYLKKVKELPLHRRDIMYFDMAYDMFIPITDIKYYKRRINEYECLIKHEKLETIYLRKWGVNGTVRIYDKVLELNGGINEDLDHETGEVKKIKYTGNCTRYEIRVKPGEYSKHINILDPFLLEYLVKLHKLEIKENTEEEKILKEIEKSEGLEFINLLAIHNGYEKKINKNTRKKYKDLYKGIKKRAEGMQPTTHSMFTDFNTQMLFKTFKTFLDSITFNTDSSILWTELIEKN